MHPPFSVKVCKEYFNFASCHFLIFTDGTREPLHGHNYRVRAEGKGVHLEGDLLFDFLHFKPLVKEICDSLNHRLLLPSKNPALLIEPEGDNWLLMPPDGSRLSVPKKDVFLLPLPNTSVERLAMYINSRLRPLLKERHNFCFRELEIEVEETPGQSATFLWREEDR